MTQKELEKICREFTITSNRATAYFEEVEEDCANIREISRQYWNWKLFQILPSIDMPVIPEELLKK